MLQKKCFCYQTCIVAVDRLNIHRNIHTWLHVCYAIWDVYSPVQSRCQRTRVSETVKKPIDRSTPCAKLHVYLLCICTPTRRYQLFGESGTETIVLNRSSSIHFNDSCILFREKKNGPDKKSQSLLITLQRITVAVLIFLHIIQVYCRGGAQQSIALDATNFI